MITKNSKKQNIETRTTLDSLHNLQIKKMTDHESELKVLLEEKKELEESLKNNEDTTMLDQIERKLKNINTSIDNINNKNEFFDYFLNTGDILFNYYDIQEKIQDGKIVGNNKKKVGAIFDILEQTNTEEKTVSRDKLLEEYLKKVHPESVKSTTNICEDTYGDCPMCEEEMVFSSNEAVFTCKNCGHQEFVLIDSDKPSYKDPPREVSYYAYKRINHFNEWLAQLQAKETTEIPQEVFDQILVELKKERILNLQEIKQRKIREILKKLKLNKYYEHVSHITHRLNGQNAPIMSREIEEKLRFMFKEIQPSFVKHCPSDRNNFLSYSYVLYKFCELLELDEYLRYFPLLKNRDKLYAQDKIWEKICKDLRWQYVKSL